MTDVDDYDDDDWKYEDLHPVREEPDWNCWTCEDAGVVQGAKQVVNCPSCWPTPRQCRRQAYRDRRRAERFARDVAAGRIVLDTEAPF